MVAKSPVKSATDAAALWQELDLLSRLGVGLAPVAAAFARVLRGLTGADAAALYWLDAQGLPEGFFHEDSPRGVQDLFLTEFERLFLGENELNVTALAQRQGAPIGHLLAPGAGYFRSHTYNLLVRASGHHRTLDLRVEVEGRTRAVVLLFRNLSNHRAFGEGEIATLKRARPYLAGALSQARAPADWSSQPTRSGHLVIDPRGETILLMDEEASALLTQANLVAPHAAAMAPVASLVPAAPGVPIATIATLATITPVAPAARVPPCLRQLAPQAADPLRLPMPGGALVAEARPLHSPASGMAGGTLIRLTLEQPRALAVIERILATRLSPLQREIALLAGLGHPRGDCGPLLGVSAEALKKHLRVIFAATGTRDWETLASALSQPLNPPLN